MTDLEHIYLSAVRYALGRTTYVVALTTDFMMKQVLSKTCKELMIRDIERSPDLGHGCDKESWEELLAHLKFQL